MIRMHDSVSIRFLHAWDLAKLHVNQQSVSNVLEFFRASKMDKYL